MLIKILSLRSLLPRCCFPDNTWLVHSVPSRLYSDTSRPEESSTFPLWASVIQASHVLPTHFLGNILTVFLLRWEDKYQIWERPGQCITFSGWKKRRSGGRSMRGAAHIQMGVLSGRTKGSFCSPLFSRRLGASSRLLSDEARGTLFPISGGGRGSRIPRALRPGHVGLLCAPHHLVQGTCPLWAWEEARPCHRFLQKTAKNPSPCSTHTLLWIS